MPATTIDLQQTNPSQLEYKKEIETKTTDAIKNAVKSQSTIYH
jgi:hypothetical protein